MGYSPWGHKESHTTERLTHTQTSQIATGLVGKCKELRLYSDTLLNDFKLGKYVVISIYVETSWLLNGEWTREGAQVKQKMS